jgi:hypothetical protein
MTLLINHDKCLVLSCSIGNELNKYDPAYLHFFGENAISVGYRTNNEENLVQDKTKLCARPAGALLRSINDLNSNHMKKISSSVTYFKGLFDYDKYTIDLEDFKQYKEDSLISEMPGLGLLKEKHKKSMTPYRQTHYHKNSKLISQAPQHKRVNGDQRGEMSQRS